MEFKAFKQTSAKVSVLQSHDKTWTTLKAFHGRRFQLVVFYAQYRVSNGCGAFDGPLRCAGEGAGLSSCSDMAGICRCQSGSDSLGLVQSAGKSHLQEFCLQEVSNKLLSLASALVIACAMLHIALLFMQHWQPKAG